MSLSPDDKATFLTAFSHVTPEAPAATALMMTGANLLPHGHRLLAEQVLTKGLSIAPTEEIQARLHLNLAQLYNDHWEETKEDSWQQKVHHHCHHCLQLNYFTNYIQGHLLKN